MVDNPNVAADARLRQGLRLVPRDLGGGGARDRDGPRPRPSPRTACAFLAGRASRAAVPALAPLREPARALHAAAALRHGLPRRRRRRGRSRFPVVPRLPWRHPEAVGGGRAGPAAATTWRSTTARSPRSTSEVGRVLDALAASAVRDRTLVIVTSDHGESLGEHDYYFDHGEDLFDPSLRIPFVVVGPGAQAGRRSRGARLDPGPRARPFSTRSRCPTLRTWPGRACCPRRGPDRGRDRARLQAQNDRNLIGDLGPALQDRGDPRGRRAPRYALYDRAARSRGDARRRRAGGPTDLREQRRELELFQERVDREWARTRRLVAGAVRRGEAERRRPARS